MYTHHMKELLIDIEVTIIVGERDGRIFSAFTAFKNKNSWEKFSLFKNSVKLYWMLLTWTRIHFFSGRILDPNPKHWYFYKKSSIEYLSELSSELSESISPARAACRSSILFKASLRSDLTVRVSASAT